MSMNFQQAQTAAIETYQELGFLMSSGQKAKLQSWLLELRMLRRPYLISSTEMARQYWMDIRSEDDIQDFVSRGSVLFALKLGGDKKARAWGEDIGTSIENICARPRQRSGTSSAYTFSTDEDYTSKLPASGVLTNILRTEIWLAFVLTLELSISHLGIVISDDEPS